MHGLQWGLTESPFRSQSRSKYFFASPTHDEALARLGFLVNSGYALGVVAGHEGCGRSTILEVFSREMRRQGHAVCLQNLLGLDERSMLWSLAADLGTNPKASDETFLLWYQLHNRLQQFALQGRATILMLDDADQASHDVLIQVTRLLKMHVPRLAIILSVEASRLTRLGSDLLQLSNLRIRLDPWSAEDIRRYLETSMAAAGCTRQVFDETAAIRLCELTDGIPRWVGQIAELALLAAAGQQRETIGAELIESVYQELSASFDEDPAAARY